LSGGKLPLKSPVASIPATVTEETEHVGLGPRIVGITRNPTDAPLPLEEAERQAGVDPRARPVPGDAFEPCRRNARARHQVPAARRALLAVAADSMKPSGPDTTTWAIHGWSLRLGDEGY
jgi:hypothetical protein